jgi:hypothetical protein
VNSKTFSQGYWFVVMERVANLRARKETDPPHSSTLSPLKRTAAQCPKHDSLNCNISNGPTLESLKNL